MASAVGSLKGKKDVGEGGGRGPTEYEIYSGVLNEETFPFLNYFLFLPSFPLPVIFSTFKLYVTSDMLNAQCMS